jgi:putative SOS response-associated peptidase YedK
MALCGHTHTPNGRVPCGRVEISRGEDVLRMFVTGALSSAHRGTENFGSTSALWRMWLKPENRCLVPANSFAEYAPEPNPETRRKDVVWFALNEDRSLFAFAGIWTTFDRGTKSKPIPGPHQVYGFLTTEANAVVKRIHPKAMRVILTTGEDRRSGCARAVG